MSRCRLFIDTPLHVDRAVALAPEQSHYLRTVMRLAVGDTITLCDGLGREGMAELTLLSRDRGECRTISVAVVDRELPLAVHIVQAANSSDKIETVLQKGTELGAASFTIVNSERSQLQLPAHKVEDRLTRWRRIVLEAAEQSGRTRLPKVTWCPKLVQIEVSPIAWVLHPDAATSWNLVRDQVRACSDITLAIGPEGGWSARDLELLAEMGFRSLAFGPRTMRTETAAPALLAAVLAVVD